jgi:hypothetical protein
MLKKRKGSSKSTVKLLRLQEAHGRHCLMEPSLSSLFHGSYICTLRSIDITHFPFKTLRCHLGQQVLTLVEFRMYSCLPTCLNIRYSPSGYR